MITADTHTPSVLIGKLDQKTPRLARLEYWQKQPQKLLYQILVPKALRRTWRQSADADQQQHLAMGFDQFIELYEQSKLAQSPSAIHPKKTLPETIIWQYWGQGINDNLPEVVKLCFDSVDRYKGKYTVIRLDDHSIDHYLTLPDFVWQKRNNPEFKHAFFADLLRLALLSKYGGIWIDATVLLTKEIDDDLLGQPFFMYQRDDKACDQAYWQALNGDYFGWQKDHQVRVLNSFIIAKKDDRRIGALLGLLLNFWYYQNCVTHYFFFQILFNRWIIKHPGQNCAIIDDTLPHRLISYLRQLDRSGQPINRQHFAKITEQVGIHKLTYMNDRQLALLRQCL